MKTIKNMRNMRDANEDVYLMFRIFYFINHVHRKNKVGYRTEQKVALSLKTASNIAKLIIGESNWMQGN